MGILQNKSMESIFADAEGAQKIFHNIIRAHNDCRKYTFIVSKSDLILLSHNSWGHDFTGKFDWISS